MIKNPTKSIEKQIYFGNSSEVMKNFKNIVPTIEAIFLRDRQYLALRSHRDPVKSLYVQIQK